MRTIIENNNVKTVRKLNKIEFGIIFLCLTSERRCTRKFAKELMLKIKERI